MQRDNINLRKLRTNTKLASSFTRHSNGRRFNLFRRLNSIQTSSFYSLNPTIYFSQTLAFFPRFSLSRILDIKFISEILIFIIICELLFKSESVKFSLIQQKKKYFSLLNQ